MVRLVYDAKETVPAHIPMIEMFVSWVVILLAVLPLILFGWAEHIFWYSAAWIGIFALIDLWMILKGPAVVARFLENQI